MLGGNMGPTTVQQYLTSSEVAQIIVENNYYEINECEILNNQLSNMLQDSRVMPAFGVSIHQYTLDDMKNGVWLKLSYNGEQWVDEMPFDELLIKVDKAYSGFNIIRGNKGIYEGRCYYINLVDTTMKDLYNFIIGYIENKNNI